MLQALKSTLQAVPGLRPVVRRIKKELFWRNKPLDAEKFIRENGHRAYTGQLDAWEAIAKLQFDFLLARGLRPHHRLLDVACGCFRLGRLAIPYLEAGHYAGIDREAKIIDEGIEHELGLGLCTARRPILLCNGDFDFAGLGTWRADIAWSHSLFTHLIPESIERCLRGVRKVIAADGVYYTTYWFAESERAMRRNWTIDHPFGGGCFTRDWMERFGRNTGWRFEYIGEWGHPKGQVMVAYRPA